MASLGKTGLEVFGLCLGGNVFGWRMDDENAFAILDAYAAAGGNFIDTADVYGRRGPEGLGASELVIGRWIAARGNREELVIATKVGMAGELHGLSAQTIARGARDSLRRLGIDAIDLFYAHEDDPETPLAETLASFGQLIDEGLIRHAAASNYSASRLAEAVELGMQPGHASYVALQPHYNLMERGEFEADLLGLCEREGIGCVPYYGLARGFLTGKYRPDGPEIDSPRAAGVRESYLNERGIRVLEALDEVAAARGVSVAAVSLAWLRLQPTVVAPIASATSVEQLREVLQSVDLELHEDELERLGAASA
ncbi:MAG: aldo/keto reductase [Solirubrobacteraceae bacterium]